jgi:hypothetical protein
MQITRTSMLTGKTHTREINCLQAQLNLYASGKYLIQDIFPMLSDDDREFIKTGATPEEWAELFPEGDEEEDLPF